MQPAPLRESRRNSTADGPFVGPLPFHFSFFASLYKFKLCQSFSTYLRVVSFLLISHCVLSNRATTCWFTATPANYGCILLQLWSTSQAHSPKLVHTPITAALECKQCCRAWRALVTPKDGERSTKKSFAIKECIQSRNLKGGEPIRLNFQAPWPMLKNFYSEPTSATMFLMAQGRPWFKMRRGTNLAKWRERKNAMLKFGTKRKLASIVDTWNDQFSRVSRA